MDQPLHKGMQRLVRDLNLIYGDTAALWEVDSHHSGFQWIDANNAAQNIVSFIRRSPTTGRELVCVGNFSPIVRENYRLGLPRAGEYRMLLNSDNDVYGGSGAGVVLSITAESSPLHGQ